MDMNKGQKDFEVKLEVNMDAMRLTATTYPLHSTLVA